MPVDRGWDGRHRFRNFRAAGIRTRATVEFASLLLDVVCPRNYSRRFMNRTLRFVLPLDDAGRCLSFPAIAHTAPNYLPGGWKVSGSGRSERYRESRKTPKNSSSSQNDTKQRADYKRAGRLLSPGGASVPPVRDRARRPQFKIRPKWLEKEGKLQRGVFNEYQGPGSEISQESGFRSRAPGSIRGSARPTWTGSGVDIYGVPTLPSMAKAQEMFPKDRDQRPLWAGSLHWPNTESVKPLEKKPDRSLQPPMLTKQVCGSLSEQ